MKNEILNDKLKGIWKKYKLVEPFKNVDLQGVIKRSYCYAEPEQTGKIMVVGFNPSYKEGIDGVNTYNLSNAKHSYFTTIRNTLPDTMDTSYLDLFYFKYTEQATIQKLLNNEGKNGLSFMVEQLCLTQEVIEESKPKLMIVLNKGAWAYLGFHKKYVWMGYAFEEVKGIDLTEGTLMRITGIRESSLRIMPEMQSTNLVGTLVYFSYHLNRVPQERRNIIKGEISRIKSKFDI